MILESSFSCFRNIPVFLVIRPVHWWLMHSTFLWLLLLFLSLLVFYTLSALSLSCHQGILTGLLVWHMLVTPQLLFLASPELQSHKSNCLLDAVLHRASSFRACYTLGFCCHPRISGSVVLGWGSTIYTSSTFPCNAELGIMH